MSLYHLYHFDEVVHSDARIAAEQIVLNPQDTLSPNIVERLAAAYLDLREKRGIPAPLRCSPTIQLASGRYYNLLDPESTPLHPEDIAAALSKLVRCNGHTLGEIGVTIAQHCVLAARAAPKGFKFEALMHDAVEAVTGDITTPFKQCLPDFKRIEKYNEHVLRRQYYLPPELSPEVKDVDIRLAATEKRDVMPPDLDGTRWSLIEGVKPYDLIIEPWTSEHARRRWLFEFKIHYAEHDPESASRIIWRNAA